MCPTEEVYFKTSDKHGSPVVFKLNLPQVDARQAVKAAPDEYSATAPEGFAVTSEDWSSPIKFASPVGPHGGNPKLAGTVGVLAVMRAAPKAKGSAAA